MKLSRKTWAGLIGGCMLAATGLYMNATKATYSYHGYYDKFFEECGTSGAIFSDGLLYVWEETKKGCIHYVGLTNYKDRSKYASVAMVDKDGNYTIDKVFSAEIIVQDSSIANIKRESLTKNLSRFEKDISEEEKIPPVDKLINMVLENKEFIKPYKK